MSKCDPLPMLCLQHVTLTFISIFYVCGPYGGVVLPLILSLQLSMHTDSHVKGGRCWKWVRKKARRFPNFNFRDFLPPPDFHVHPPHACRWSTSRVRPGKRRPRNPVHHHQFGIYQRLRTKHDLYPRRKLRKKRHHCAPEQQQGYEPPERGRDTTNTVSQAHQQDIHEELDALDTFHEAWADDTEPARLAYDVQRRRSVAGARGIPSTYTRLMEDEGVTSTSVDSLLKTVDVLATQENQNALLDLFSTVKEDRARAYVAAAKLKEALRVTPVPGAGQAGVYLADGRPGSNAPIVFDTGCSVSITPFEDDFVTPLVEAPHAQLDGLVDVVKVKGVGTVEWPIRDVFGQVAMLRHQAYYCPEADIRLEGPISYFIEHGSGHCHLDHRRLEFVTAEGVKLIFPYHPTSNLPLMFLDQNIHVQGPTAIGAMLGRVLLGDVTLQEQVQTLLNDNNHNISNPQKELLLWHYRLAHAGQGWVQDLMHKVKHEVGGEPETIIRIKHATAARCEHPKCPACQLGKQHRRTPDSSTVVQNPDMEMAIRRDDLSPGDCISMDQYVCRTKGRLPDTAGDQLSVAGELSGSLTPETSCKSESNR